jgi:hypothetical protein
MIQQNKGNFMNFQLVAQKIYMTATILVEIAYKHCNHVKKTEKKLLGHFIQP